MNAENAFIWSNVFSATELNWDAVINAKHLKGVRNSGTDENFVLVS
jgi:hypothetical protein